MMKHTETIEPETQQMNPLTNQLTVAFVIGALLLLSRMTFAVAAEQTQPGTLPTVEAIIQKHVAAVGGQKAIESLKSMVATGSRKGAGSTETEPFELHKLAPNKWFSLTAFEYVFDGKMGWRKLLPDGHIEPMNEVDIETLPRLFDIPLDAKASFSEMKVRDKVRLGDREFFIIDAQSSAGKAWKLYFDVKTGLLARQGYKGPIDFEYWHEDYKEVNGLKIPHSLRMAGEQGFTITFTNVRLNAPVDSTRFQKPKE